MLKPRVTVQVEDGVLVAEFWDCLRLDPAPVADLRTRYESHRKSGGKADLVIDMNGVDFAGSSALSGFVTIQRLGRQHGGRVVICNVEPQVREVLRVTKLESLFAFATDVPSALAMLASSARPDPPSKPTSGGPGDDAEAPDRPARRPSSSGSPPPLRRRRRAE